MAHNSNIEWTQTTWNPVVGCKKVSAGCANCYAERMAKRLAAMARAALVRRETDPTAPSPGRTANYMHVVDDRGRWNGRVFLDDAAVADPLAWRLPRTIFVNSMSWTRPRRKRPEIREIFCSTSSSASSTP